MMLSSSRTILVMILLGLLPSAVASVDLSFLGVTSDAVHVENSANGNGLEASAISVAKPPPVQQCWVQALKIFQPSNEKELKTTSEVCQNMAPQHQKALAFELARCHLEDLGRRMLETVVGGNSIEDPHDCTINDDDEYNKDSSFPNLPRCLSSLTDAGVNAYTLFFAQIVQLCNRLTTHLASSWQQHTAMELAKISHKTVEHFTTIIQQQQAVLHEREQEMRQQHQEFFHAMKEQQESLREKEASRFEALRNWSASIMDSWKLRDKEQKEHHDKLASLWEAQSAKLEQQYQRKLAFATSFVQPILTLETWVTLAAYAYRLLVIFLHFLLLSIACYFATRPSRCRRVRGLLLLLIMMESMAEVCIYFMMDDLVAEQQKKEMIASLRPTLLCVEALIYFVNLIFSCCCCDWGAWFSNEDEEDEYDSLVEDDEMRSEFRLLLTETASHTAVPLASTTPAAATTTSSSLGAPSSSTSTRPTAETTSNFPGAKPDIPSTPTASFSDDDATKKNDTQPKTEVATLSPVVTGVVEAVPEDQSRNKRTAMEIHSSDDDSEAAVDDNSPSKRRRVEVDDKATEEPTATVMEEEEYHTAAEEEEQDGSEDDNSATEESDEEMVDGDDDEDEDKTKDEEKAKDEDKTKDEDEESKMEES